MTKNTVKIELYLRIINKIKEMLKRTKKKVFWRTELWKKTNKQKILQICFYERLCRTTQLIHCVLSGNAWTLLLPKNKKLLFCVGHGLNALLCHPSPKKTRAPFSLPAARTQQSLLMQLLLPVRVPTAEDDGHAKPMQRQNSLHNISRENTVHAERERKLNQHHTGGCVLPQLIFSLRGLGYNGC